MSSDLSPSVSPAPAAAWEASPPPGGREKLLVELVDAEGRAVGESTVVAAHQAPGLLHRAFSVFLRDPAGRVLLQQRAAVKTRFPLRWANTCCGHPLPGEAPATAAARRLTEEVGVAGVELTEVGVYSYYAEDPATGRVEYEYDHVLVGDVTADLEVLADPTEVADVRWVPLEELAGAISREPRAYAPWLGGVTERLRAHLSTSDSAGPGSPGPAGSAGSSGSAGSAGSPGPAGSLGSPVSDGSLGGSAAGPGGRVGGQGER